MSRIPGREAIVTGLALVLFGVAFGYVEAAVVVNLRTIYDPPRRSVYRGLADDDLLPALTLDELTRFVPGGLFLLRVELGRELATLAMLAGVGLAVGGSPMRRFAAFVAAFGVWDLAYYVWLRVFLGWPATVWTWDILFLLPTVWSAPVLAPAIVAATMVVCGLHTIARDDAGRPLRPGWRGWVLLVVGGLMIYGSFVENSGLIAEGGVPWRFDWPLFTLGESLALVGYVVSAVRRPATPVVA